MYGWGGSQSIISSILQLQQAKNIHKVLSSDPASKQPLSFRKLFELITSERETVVAQLTRMCCNIVDGGCFRQYTGRDGNIVANGFCVYRRVLSFTLLGPGVLTPLSPRWAHKSLCRVFLYVNALVRRTMWLFVQAPSVFFPSVIQGFFLRAWS